ncbi:MAG: hypothetical protein ACXWE7_13425, partial [Nitrososphaeraceae archaeon]
RLAVENLNKIIEHNFYALDEYLTEMVDGKERNVLDENGDFIRIKDGKIRTTNLRHRPLAIGVSGFADMLFLMDIYFTHPTTRLVNKMFFACMYWNALAKSIDLAIEHGGPYESFKGSPFSEGKLQFDLWMDEFIRLGPNEVTKREDLLPLDPSTWGQKPYVLCNDEIILPTWESIKEFLVKHGCRNALLLSLMPTATSANTLDNCESCEPYQENFYSKRLMSGDYPVCNFSLLNDLREIDLYDGETIEYIIKNDGSVKNLCDFTEKRVKLTEVNMKRLKYLESKYKISWEINPEELAIQSRDRSIYIDQGSSFNCFIDYPQVKVKGSNETRIHKYHKFCHKLRLKTCMYYLRSKKTSTVENYKINKEASKIKNNNNNIVKDLVCRRDDGCDFCQ